MSSFIQDPTPAPAPRDRVRNPMRVLLALLALCIVTDVVSTFAELDLLSVLDRLEAGEDVSFERVEDADVFSGMALLAQIGVAVAASAAFIVWLHRARGALDSIGAPGQRYGRGWTIGAWFIPLVNLVLPKKIMNDVWRGASPAGEADPRVSSLVHWWWAVWIMAGLLGNASGQIFLQAQTLSEQQSASNWAVTANVGWAICAVLAMLTVRAVTARVRARVAEGGAPVAEGSTPVATWSPWTPERPQPEPGPVAVAPPVARRSADGRPPIVAIPSRSRSRTGDGRPPIVPIPPRPRTPDGRPAIVPIPPRQRTPEPPDPTKAPVG